MRSSALHRIGLPRSSSRAVVALAAAASLCASFAACDGDTASGGTDAVADSGGDTFIDADTFADAASDTADSGADTASAADTAGGADTGAVPVLADWTTETHSKDVPPNLDEVFSDTEVKRFDIVLAEEEWQAMLDDMTAKYGALGGTSSGPGGGPGGGGGGPVTVSDDEDPIFVPADVFYEGRQWYHVGVRFKGNSSLESAWRAGILKLSLKLDFDEFEDTYPEIDNQRFYGIKKLSLKNNYDDPSGLREKVMADLFADAGLVVSRTAFYTVYIDHGDGPEYFGLYTLVEEVDDSVLDTQYDSDDGNLYKPDGTSASFAAGTFDEADFVKKTNEDDADWSDILELFDVLGDATRTSNPAAWRASLDDVFDTDVFLHYLAINTVAQNWDTYGRMTHNYFLYDDPATGKLTWIPWDNNEALQTGKLNGSLPLDFAGLNASAWPLIGYLYADDVLGAVYDDYVERFIDGPFETTLMAARYDTYAPLVEAAITSEREGFTFLNRPSEFASAITALKTHAQSRANAARAYLGL